MATVVYLVRHGETEWNRDARIQGQLDVELSDVGRAQARLLSARLGRIPLDAVYSSDLSRAMETARTIAEPAGLDVRLAQEFREIDFGAWQGLGWREVESLYPGSREQLRADPANSRPPGGESWPEVACRVMRGLERLAAEWPSGEIAVVSHGGTGRMAICSILGIDLKMRWRITMDNTGISVLIRRDGEWSVGSLNDTCHLAEHGVTAHDD